MKKRKDYFITALGIILLLTGLYLMKTTDSAWPFLTALPYVCIGVGSGSLGHGLGNLLSVRALRKNPALQKQMEINSKDERNITIANRAKARAYDAMIFLFGALMIAFALMGVDVAPLLLLVFAYLLVQGYAVYYRCKYDKEM